jgi:ArsR family transcriptional regulator, arsenate/arsenite/antimonite-responsive transcriptional repressor
MLSPGEITKVRKYLGGKDEALSEVFKVLSEPNRCKMFRAIAKHKKLSVSDAANILNISLPLASQHLKVLLQGNMLLKQKDSRKVYYSLNRENPIVESVLKAIQ